MRKCYAHNSGVMLKERGMVKRDCGRGNAGRERQRSKPTGLACCMLASCIRSPRESCTLISVSVLHASSLLDKSELTVNGSCCARLLAGITIDTGLYSLYVTGDVLLRKRAYLCEVIGRSAVRCARSYESAIC